MKKLVFIGAVALVVLGCVIAAGCTSTEQTGAAEPIVGEWQFPYDDGAGVTGIGIEVITDDGTGFWVLTTDDGKRLLKYDAFTWKKNDDGTYAFAFEKEDRLATLVYDASTDTYTDSHNVLHTRLDPLAGIWSTIASAEDGEIIKSSVSLYPDGTGWICRLLDDDGTSEVIQLAWKKNDDGTYTCVKANGDVRTWTLDPAQQTFTSNTGRVSTKAFTDSYYYLSVLGPWYNAEMDILALFYPDGTGIINRGGVVANYTWTIPEFGSFKLNYLDGPGVGKESMWTYDRVNDVFITGEAIGSSQVLVRPTENVEGLTILRFPAEPLAGL